MYLDQFIFMIFRRETCFAEQSYYLQNVSANFKYVKIIIYFIPSLDTF